MATPHPERAPTGIQGKLEQLQLLFELADAVSRAQEPNEIYQAAVVGLVRALGADRSAVLIYDPDGVMRFKAWIGLSDEYRKAVEGHTPWSREARDAQPLTFPDATLEPSLSPYRQVIAKEKIRAIAFVPLLGKVGLIGKFMLYYNARHEFLAEELQVAQTIATHVAFAAERQMAEAALRESEQRFRAIFFQAAVGMAQTSLQGEWLQLNDRFCEITGYSRDELREKNVLDMAHPDDRESCHAVLGQMVANGTSSYSVEKRYLRKDGAVIWVRLYVALVRGQDNSPLYFIGVVEDVTDQKQAERALVESELRLDLAQSTASLGVWDCDLRKNVITISSEYARLYGLESNPTSLTGQEWLRLVHADDRERVLAHLQDSIQRTHVWDAEFRILRPDGTVRWLLGKGSVFLDESGQAIRMAGVNFDITERKHAEAALRESEERFRKMADAAPMMICASGPDGRATFFNRCWLDFTGRRMEDELGYGWTEGLHPDDLDTCLASYSSSFAARRDCRIEYRLRRADGTYRSLVYNGVPCYAADGVFAGYVASALDITDVKRAQEEALAAQKLESMGLLASGIAHDFNNLLGGILASTELALSERADSKPVGEELQRIRTASIRGSEIVRQLMIYGGQESPAFEPVDLNLLIEEMLQLLKVSISKHALLKTALGQKLPAVHANPAQIRQVVMNLVTNASEAIGENEGVIRVSTALVRGSRQPGDEAESDKLRLEVSDTGTGIATEAQTRIFDPFFTTKDAGRGLGLAVVQGIIRAHGGVINVTSSPGQGSTLQVLLPCAVQKAKPNSSRLAPAADPTLMRAGTILVVEDEELLRLAVSKALRKKGFAVLEAGDGSTAMNLMRGRKPSGIDVVLLDVTLPGVSSREVLQEAQRLRPAVKVILTSAYGKDAVVASFAGLRVERFLRKPFQLADLVGALRDTLSASQ